MDTLGTEEEIERRETGWEDDLAVEEHKDPYSMLDMEQCIDKGLELEELNRKIHHVHQRSRSLTPRHVSPAPHGAGQSRGYHHQKSSISSIPMIHDMRQQPRAIILPSSMPISASASYSHPPPSLQRTHHPSSYSTPSPQSSPPMPLLSSSAGHVPSPNLFLTQDDDESDSSRYGFPNWTDSRLSRQSSILSSSSSSSSASSSPLISPSPSLKRPWRVGDVFEWRSHQCYYIIQHYTEASFLVYDRTNKVHDLSRCTSNHLSTCAQVKPSPRDSHQFEKVYSKEQEQATGSGLVVFLFPRYQGKECPPLLVGIEHQRTLESKLFHTIIEKRARMKHLIEVNNQGVMGGDVRVLLTCPEWYHKMKGQYETVMYNNQQRMLQTANQREVDKLKDGLKSHSIVKAFFTEDKKRLVQEQSIKVMNALVQAQGGVPALEQRLEQLFVRLHNMSEATPEQLVQYTETYTDESNLFLILSFVTKEANIALFQQLQQWEHPSTTKRAPRTKKAQTLDGDKDEM
jgi:hypothetical protein